LACCLLHRGRFMAVCLTDYSDSPKWMWLLLCHQPCSTDDRIGSSHRELDNNSFEGAPLLVMESVRTCFLVDDGGLVQRTLSVLVFGLTGVALVPDRNSAADPVSP